MQKLKKVIILIGAVIIASAAVLGYYYIPSSNIPVKTYNGRRFKIYYNEREMAIYEGAPVGPMSYDNAEEANEEIKIEKDSDIVLEALIPAIRKTKLNGEYIVLYKNGIMKYIICSGGFTTDDNSPLSTEYEGDLESMYCNMYGDKKEKIKKLTKKQFDCIVNLLNEVEEKCPGQDNFEGFYSATERYCNNGLCYNGKVYGTDTLASFQDYLEYDKKLDNSEVDEILKNARATYFEIIDYLIETVGIMDIRFYDE